MKGGGEEFAEVDSLTVFLGLIGVHIWIVEVRLENQQMPVVRFLKSLK